MYQSNPQQDNYLWGKVATINYIGATGAPIKGLLYYPTDYKKGKIYPMIVHVYQKQSHQLHYYRNPSNPVTDGYSELNFATQGYFVLMPDIDYIMGEPADSAVTCVTAAVNAVLSQVNINPKKIGLIGHSFGGFESNSTVPFKYSIRVRIFFKPIPSLCPVAVTSNPLPLSSIVALMPSASLINEISR